MKALRFIINSNIFIALAAVSLALSTGVQTGIPIRFHAYLPVIFFATLLDYNLHRVVAMYNKAETLLIEKYQWAAKHLGLLKIFIASSLAGLVISLLFVRLEILYLLAPLAVISFLYSSPFRYQQKKQFRLLGIPGIKTLLIALVWTAVTVFLPVIQTGNASNYTQLLLVFAERFTFIFAIAIPFDIRDMKADSQAGIKSIPATFGEQRALLICNFMMALSISVACYHYLSQNMHFILSAYIVSVILTTFFINFRKIRSTPLYYHGILDGSILLHGLMISLSFYL